MDHAQRQQTSLHTWAQLEALHDLTYFAKECRDAYKKLGVGDSWARYFGGRSAPMGRVNASVVTATFYSFAHRLIAPSIPSVWEVATPDQFIRARFEGFRATWERIMSASTLAPSQAAHLRAAALAMRAAVTGSQAGHVLYSANLEIQAPDDPVSQLFHAATLIREYRGDSHNNLLAAHRIDGCQAHILMVAIGAEDRESSQRSRGYTDDEWATGADTLIGRGYLDTQQNITPAGRSFRADLERATNQLMGQIFDVLSHRELSELAALTAPIAMAIHASGSLPNFTRAFEVLELDESW